MKGDSTHTSMYNPKFLPLTCFKEQDNFLVSISRYFSVNIFCLDNGNIKKKEIINFVAKSSHFVFISIVVRESKVQEDMESNKCTRDINPSLENSPREDKDQCIEGWNRRERWSVRERTVFHPSWDGEIHPGANEPRDTRKCSSQNY